MPYKNLFEAMMGGWWIGPHFPKGSSPDKAAFPDHLQAYQSFHVLMADSGPCASGATEAELLEAINRITAERGGPWTA